MRTQTAAYLTTAMMCVVLATATAQGQHYGQPQANSHPGIGDPPHYQPFGDLGVNYDLQLFAPPIIEDYGDDAFAANYGWYIQYDRMQLHVSRPDVTGQFDGINPDSDRTFEMDRTWGNRFDIGYMTEENSGWNFGTWKINDTGTFQRETIPGFVAGDDLVDIDEFDALTSINSIRAQSLEFSKTFRLPPTAHGLIREPFFGVRFIETQDRYERTIRTFTTAVPNEFDIIIDDDGTPRLLTIRETDRTINDASIQGDTNNNMIGAQLGTRWYMDRGHWRISAEVRGFAAQNFAAFGASGNQQTTVVRTQRVVGVVPPDIDFVIPPEQTFVLDQTFEIVNPARNDSVNEFTLGGELRLETQYHLTREISLRFGMELFSIGRGIIRSPVTPDADTVFTLLGTEEDLVAVGYTFGIEVNR